jgi:hypothetical protein
MRIPIPDMEQSTTIWYLMARVQFESIRSFLRQNVHYADGRLGQSDTV